jgi:carbamoyl-phosphate synthase large subunit
MPKRTDIKTILLIGSGPIVIGQACEFDYSGTQAIKALKEEGYRVILINSNPATIMTDPEFAHRTYIEPITPEFVEEVIKIERPDAILPTMGGQTALNTALALDEMGILKKYNVELIGAKVDAIKTAEDRELFRRAMDEIGLESAKSELCTAVSEVESISKKIGFPIILRPSRTLGGTGGGIANNIDELKTLVSRALVLSPNGEVLLEESLIGWKEMELEVMRDLKDNVVIICGIENIDPMGVHTGDSITVAPIQTLTDKEYQLLRDASIKVIRRIGVDTGGSNVQFAINPNNGRIVVIEMNPRVSRSSALASKATGFPIAKIAAKLAIGYTLDEIPNDITKLTPACFEPSIDYVVVKIPRFNFEKFPLADPSLGTQMKSVGEVLSFGRNFSEAFQKALTSMEMDTAGFDRSKLVSGKSKAEVIALAAKPTAHRIWYVAEALRLGATVEELFDATRIDTWFLEEFRAVIDTEELLKKNKFQNLAAEELRALKREGFTDKRLADLYKVPEHEVRALRLKHGVLPNFKAVDTCAAEFHAETPYLYSCYDHGDEMPPSKREKVIILGSGPNRIGQGIEFDYCCVHGVFAIKEEQLEAIMINCNPETVSTDYDISDRLYFEPLTFEHVMSIIDREKPKGVILQFGGQTPLKLARRLHEAGVKILGTSVDSIDAAEDRKLFNALIDKVGLKQPRGGTATSLEEAIERAEAIGFPLMIRPSFVLGGRSMRILHSIAELEQYMSESIQVSHERPVLLDAFLQDAIEVDVDALADGTDAVICGVMEHIERAGIHSGDSSCCLPPPTLSAEVVCELKRQARLLAQELRVVGLLNVQFAVTQNNEIFIIEANPRASRTVPFVSKATGVPWVKRATKVMLGKTLAEVGAVETAPTDYFAIKACVFPFSKFHGVDPILGPEMKSTGEVMGLHDSFAGGFAKALIASNQKLPTGGKVFLSVMDFDKKDLVAVAQSFLRLGFAICATRGTGKVLQDAQLPVEIVNKVREGSPHIVDMIQGGAIQLVVNTPEGSGPFMDSKSIRLMANEMNIPTFTTLSQASAGVSAIEMLKRGEVLSVKALQDYFYETSNNPTGVQRTAA